jgi:hopanoid C-3 methylase HpnR
MYSKIYLRLEPLGLELVAAAARGAGHTVRLIDLQCEPHQNFYRLVKRWRPNVIAFSVNYLANIPEVIDLARATRSLFPETFICVGGHSVSFIPEEILRHSGGAVDCVLIGEGETAIAGLLDTLAENPPNLKNVPGCVTLDHRGPPPAFVKSLDDLLPARDLVQHRHKYFIGSLDPAASIEFSRGCPWDCVFCSAWTFYGRNYRVKHPECAVEELAQVREPGIFIVDDVAFIQAEHGMQLGEAIARRGIRKRYYLETRGDVLLRNKEVFHHLDRVRSRLNGRKRKLSSKSNGNGRKNSINFAQTSSARSVAVSWRRRAKSSMGVSQSLKRNWRTRRQKLPRARNLHCFVKK